MFCQVIVDIVHENVDRPFTYRIPEGMTLTVGQRVAVPFGPREKEEVPISFMFKGLRLLRINGASFMIACFLAVNSNCPLEHTRAANRYGYIW